MIVKFEQSDSAAKNKIKIPERAHGRDSGYDIYCPVTVTLQPHERITIDLQIKFELPEYIWTNDNGHKLGVEAMIRPKSGRSKAGLDVEIGTIDNPYRGSCGCTVTNTTTVPITIEANHKICQIVFMPVFQHVELHPGNVSADTDRGEGGFGHTGLI
jgi:dUTP pyrophosphatase